MSRNCSRSFIFIVFPDARTKNRSSDQGYSSSDQMHHCGASEVMKRNAKCRHHKTPFVSIHQPASTPRPMPGNRIDKHADKHRIYQIHRKFCTLGHCPGNNCCRCSTKDCLKNQEPFYRQTIGNNLIHNFQIEEMRCPDKFSDSKHQSETDKPKQNRTEHKINTVFHQNVSRVFGPGKSGFD